MREAAQQRGLELDALEIFDISFIAADGVVGATHNGHDLTATYDVLVARTFYPYISEALTVARLFHAAGKVVIDQSLTDEGFVMSKMHDYLLLAQQNIPVPRTWQVYDPLRLELLAQALGYPCVLKGAHGSHGAHVYLVENAEQLRRRWLSYPAGELMLQEYLPADEDYRLLVIGYKAMPAMVSRQPSPGEFRTNVGFSTDTVAKHSESFALLAGIAEHAARVLRREFAGVDIRFNGSQPYVLEVNRRPIFENFEHVTGLDAAGRFIEYAHSRYTAHIQTLRENML
jgi:RimK family alpha-L-glutamate ligase